MVPPLPPELIAHIIKLSLPPIAFSTFPERYNTLLSFHLVNKTWSALARVELFRHMNIRTESGRCKVLNLLHAHKVDGLLERSKSLWVGHGETPTAPGLHCYFDDYEPLLQRCEHLKMVSLSNIRLKLSDLGLVSDITALLLHSVTLVCRRDPGNPPVVPTLPNLAQLALVDTAFGVFGGFSGADTEWSTFLNPTTLPNLSNLAFIYDIYEWVDAHSFERALNLIAPQIETFVFVEGCMDTVPALDDCWMHFDRIKHLWLHVWDDNYFKFLDSLHRLPAPSLVTLEVVEPAPDDEHVGLDVAIGWLRDTLDEAPPSLSSLKTVRFRGWSEENVNFTGDDDDEDALIAYKNNLDRVRELLGQEGALEIMSGRPKQWEDWIDWW